LVNYAAIITTPQRMAFLYIQSFFMVMITFTLFCLTFTHLLMLCEHSCVVPSQEVYI